MPILGSSVPLMKINVALSENLFFVSPGLTSKKAVISMQLQIYPKITPSLS